MVSWNCCGIGNPQTVQRLLDLNSKCSPDIIFLSETKNCDHKVLVDLEPLRMYSHFLVSPSPTNGGGLALLWKQEIDIQILLSTEHFINTLITFKNVSFNSTFVYGAPEIPNRQAVWDHHSAISENRDHPWFLTGDFNEIINSSEKSGGGGRGNET